MDIVDLIISDAIWMKSDDFTSIVNSRNFDEKSIILYMIVSLLNRADEYGIEVESLIEDSFHKFKEQR